MRFDWDPKKAAANQAKHGFSFELAVTAFDDPFALVVDDLKHSSLEARHWLIGKTDVGRVVVVVFTRRDNGATTRLISARPASREEKARYEEFTKVPF